MPLKPAYLVLMGAGAVVAYSGLKGKGIGSAFRSVIAGQTPAKAATANLISGSSGISGTTASRFGANAPVTGLVNPFRHVSNLSASRVDMGVDYAGTGEVVAIGSGYITATRNFGWPFSDFICIKLADYPWYWYTAEDVVPLVRVGEFVQAGQPIATMGTRGGSIEVGFAAPPGIGGTMAALTGQYFRDGVSTAYGASANRLLTKLGAPSGHLNNTPTGSVGKKYP